MSSEENKAEGQQSGGMPDFSSLSPSTLSVFEINKAQALDWPDETERLLCRAVKQDEAEAMQQLMEQAGNYPPNDALQRLAKARRGYIGQIPGIDIWAAYGWVALETEPMGNSGYAFQPPPGDAWLYDFATLPDYRGRGYYGILLHYILKDLASLGVGRAWIATAPGNSVSARSIARAGFTLVAEGRYIPAGPDHEARFEELPVLGIAPELLELARQTYVKL